MKELQMPDVPDCVRYLWDTFFDIRTLAGGENISLTLISEYQKLVEIRYTDVEVRALCSLDYLRRKILNG